MTQRIDTTAERAKLAALTGFTPGPWCAHRASGEVSGGVGGGYPVLEVNQGTYDPATASVELDDQEWSDLRLAAAAPDLLTDYRAALDEIDRLTATLAEADARGLRNAVAICKRIRADECENDDQAIGALECAIAIQDAANALAAMDTPAQGGGYE